MGIEIERKFLVTSRNFENLARAKRILQGYLCNDPEKTVRVRIHEKKAYLTVKSKVVNLSRLEFEYEISVKDAEKMMTLCPHIIEKERYEIFHKNHRWEVDKFLGENEGLLLAEIELVTPEEKFEKPDWIGEEVSLDERYFNSFLAENPYKNWSL
ncbi:MAG: CYTH domain-containing protein [Candidatus Marinimicrobia bacterium]|nr:CYTH domain-containing protein [Candidatus Neomarinimicrobiota bacterium]